MGRPSRRTVSLASASLLVTASTLAGVASGYSRHGWEPGSSQFAACFSHARNLEPHSPHQMFFEFRTGDLAWTSASRTAVVTGLKEWERVLNRDGSPGKQVVSMVETADPSKEPIAIKLKQFGAGEGVGGGTGRCATFQEGGRTFRGFINLNLQLRDLSDRLQGVATHEMGHVLGLAHTGKNDSLMDGSDSMPSMAHGGCFTSQETPDVQRRRRSLAHDDFAALVQRQGHGFSAHRDSSFEGGIENAWGIHNGNFERVAGAPGRVGDWHLKFIGTTPVDDKFNDPYIRQDVLVFTPPGQSRSYDAAARIRRESQGSGEVILKLWQRPYGAEEGTCKSVFPTGDWNLAIQRSVFPTDQFTFYETSNVELPFERVGVRMVLRSKLKEGPSGGQRSPTHVDDVRARWAG